MASRQKLPKAVVVHIIAKTPRDFSAEMKSFSELKERPISGLILQNGNTVKTVDSCAATSDESNNAVTAKHARILEIHATMKAGDWMGGATISNCRFIRNSEGMQELQMKHDVEVVVQPFNLFLKHKTPGLAIFDMDSTLIQQEVIDELARKTGRHEEVAAVTEAAMRGELDFEQSLRERVAKIKGVHRSIWQCLIRDVITITPGARELIKALKGLGWKTAVASGGFTPLANWLKDELGMDYALANHLAMDDDDWLLTGDIVPGTKVVDGIAKRDFLIQLANENNIPIENTMAVGDGSNDLPMMKAAGWGIAFNAKPKVQKEAPSRLNSSSLLDIMYLLGFSQGEIEDAVKKGGEC